MPTRQRDRIRMLNDQLRQHRIGGTVLVSRGVQALGPDALRWISRSVALFDKFDPGNDPYGEHDFGAVMLDGQVIFFKIDYYDLDCCNRSPDPADPELTRRVMTITFAEEY